MRLDVRTFVAKCLICQQVKLSHLAPAGLLQPLPIPERIWEDISLDFIVGLPISGGKTVILAVVDRLSKYAHFLPLVTNFTSMMVASIFVNEIIRLHGIPRSIVSDRDMAFISSFWQEIFRSQGTKLSMSTSYHPQTDGQTEVVNRGLEMYMRCLTMDQPRSWIRFLAWAEFWYNSAYHTSTGMTPFEIVYGRLPPSIPRYILDSIKNDVDHELRQRDEILQYLKSSKSNEKFCRQTSYR